MYKFISIVVFILLAYSSSASTSESDDHRWQYRWSESQTWKDIVSPCSPPDREDKDLLFLKLIRSNSKQTHLLIKDQSFSFELLNESGIVSDFPADQNGYLSGFKDFIVNIGSQSEIRFRAVSDAKNHIGFCKGVFLGTESTLKEKLIHESFIPFISSLVCLFLSVFLFFLSRIEISPKGFLSTSITALLLGTWTFSLPNNNFKEFLS